MTRARRMLDELRVALAVVMFVALIGLTASDQVRTWCFAVIAFVALAVVIWQADQPDPGEEETACEFWPECRCPLNQPCASADPARYVTALRLLEAREREMTGGR